MRIGWLADESKVNGGAELSTGTLVQTCPSWAELVPCPAGAVRSDVDAYVVSNCLTYCARDTVSALEQKPVVKVIRDMWQSGDVILREWLLEHSKAIIMSGPRHRDWFPYRLCGQRIHFVPPPIDINAFRDAAKYFSHRHGVIWLGNMLNLGKGIHNAVTWAKDTGVSVDFYGEGPYAPRPEPGVTYCGPWPHDRVPELFASYDKFLFLPDWPEPFGRTVAEAWASGLKLEVNRSIGALWWIEEHPHLLDKGAEMFWQAIAKELLE